MRRSEAIEIIKESLAGFTPDDEKCANWILDDLLKAGMLPPDNHRNTNDWDEETETLEQFKDNENKKGHV